MGKQGEVCLPEPAGPWSGQPFGTQRSVFYTSPVYSWDKLPRWFGNCQTAQAG